MSRTLVLATTAAAALAVVSVALSAGPPLPATAVYSGKNSLGKAARIFVSKQGTRVGYTMFVRLDCANGQKVASTNWSTEGEFAKDYWIRPRPDGSFSLSSSNSGKYTGGMFKARASFAGRFTSAAAAKGTFRGHIDYYKPGGALITRCDTGPVTWNAKR